MHKPIIFSLLLTSISAYGMNRTAQPPKPNIQSILFTAHPQKVLHSPHTSQQRSDTKRFENVLTNDQAEPDLQSQSLRTLSKCNLFVIQHSKL